MCEPKELYACENKSPSTVSRAEQPISTVYLVKERPFICSFDNCNKSYTKSQHLKRHEDTHGNSYRCTEKDCKQYFKSKAYLKKHIDNIHLKKKPKTYKCPVCDQEFNKNNWLTRHQFRHTGVKPYICPKDECGKRFLLPSKLRRHLKVHEGYTCSKENCGQTFPKWTLYVNHIKTSHPRIHRCHFCEKVFTTSSNLKSHLEIHELDREVYLCPKPNCSRFYFMKRNLTHHLKNYHEKRPFVCTTKHCFKAFKSEEDLNTHISRHDPKKRVRKKKKGKPKPNFAAWLAGYTPRKTDTHETGDEALENSLRSSEGKAQAKCDTSLEGNNQDVPNANSTGDTVSTCDVGDGMQTVSSIQETMLERKSYHLESTICISA